MIRLPRLAEGVRVWRRHVHVLRRHWTSIALPPLLDPLFFFVAFGIGFGAYVSSIDGIPYREFLGPALCATTAMWSASFEMTYPFYWRMTESGVHDNVVTTPIEPEDVVLGELLWSGTMATIYGSGFLGVIAVLGFVGSPWAVLLPIGLFAGGVAFGAFAMAVAVLIRRVEYFTFYFTLAVSPMFLFGGVFFPIDTLPGWGQVLAWGLPTYHLVEVARGVTQAAPSAEVLAHGGILIGMGCLMALVPLHRFRRRVLA